MIPRVLVVTSNNFNLQGGGGITLTNLFRGWPPDRLANIHEDATAPDHTVCSNFFRLTRQEVRWAWPLSLLERSISGASEADGANALGVQPEGRSWKRRLAGDGVPREVRISPALASWIDQFAPQLVYGFLGSMAQNHLTRLIVERWRLPLAIHIMDDWPNVIYTEGLFAPLLRRRVLREFRALLDRAAVRMVISGAMAEEYTRRYHYPFAPFQNALDMKEWSLVSRQRWDVEGRVIVRYVGSIVAEAQREALRDMCGAVAELRAEGVDITLSVHAPAAQTAVLRDWGFPEDVLRLGAPAAASDVPRLLAEADILVLPFNFDESSRQYMRFSMPTKVPAYMISGSPVLVYGPPDLATVAYAARAGWGYTVTERGGTALRSALRKLADDVTVRGQLGRRAIDLARRNHDAVSVTLAFRNALTAAVAS